MDEMTLTLNNPITEEQWDAITDVDFDNTNEITFYTKHGKVVKFVKASAQPEPHWIPVTERLPEAGSWAIWCSNKGIIQVARWKMDAIDHFFPDQGFFQLDDAVAWMPLPEPYKGEQDE